MSILRKTIVATALLGAGLGVTTGAAFAGENDHQGMTLEHDGWGGKHSEKHGDKHDDRGYNASGVQKDCKNPVAAGQHGGDQAGLLNVADVQTIVPINACNNDIPINILGVQVPIQDASANVPVGSPASGGDEDGGDGGDNGGLLGGVL